jgi:3-phenylpropionate/cinnamic acid dioxygenase small subunit
MERKHVDQALGKSVVIEAVESLTGADSIAPNHRGRGGELPTMYVPRRSVTLAEGTGGRLREEVEDLLHRQAALLDARRWQEWIDLFTDDGIYWMPVMPSQNDWLTEPSIFAEDKLMMEIRMGRLNHPNAWSQAALWGTNHLVGNLVIEAVETVEAVEPVEAAGLGAGAGRAPAGGRSKPVQSITACSRFQMMEMRRDEVRHFGGTYRHQLVRTAEGLRIRLQRVDMMNGQAAYEYVLQAWV